MEFKGPEQNYQYAGNDLRCLRCSSFPMNYDDANTKYVCKSCETSYPINNGIIDGLYDLSNDTRNELLGMIEETGRTSLNPEQFKVHTIEKVDTFEERCEMSKDMIFDYYGSCLLHFKQAIEKIKIQGNEKVLEVGSELNHPFLNYFSELGCECFATNIYFSIDSKEQTKKLPIRVLGDMNNLPYSNERFDIIIFSATLHHSNDLDKVTSEASRVLKPGGKVIAVNEPVAGLLKNFSKREDGSKENRNSDINENEYSAFKYKSAFKKHGLKGELFFPRYYDYKLQSGRMGGQRFESLAKIVSSIWKIKSVRWFLMKFGLSPGQVILGLQFNGIFKKSS